MLSFRALVFVAAVLPVSVAAQSRPPAPNPNRPVAAALRPYINCKLPGGPDLVQHTALPQAPTTRQAQTFTGLRNIRLMDGVFAAYAYPGTAPFANVKIELLPASSYTTEKNDLISEFDKINAAGEDTQRNYTLKRVLNGFEIYGFDRTALDGQLLGMYLFFDNARHVETTAYFLNAPDNNRKFQTVGEYDDLRMRFLDAYTSCVRKELSGTRTSKPAARRRAR